MTILCSNPLATKLAAVKRVVLSAVVDRGNASVFRQRFVTASAFEGFFHVLVCQIYHAWNAAHV